MGTLTLMGLSAGATAGYAWLAGPLLSALEAGLVSESSRVASTQNEILPSLSWIQIAFALVSLGLVRALAETTRANLSSRFQLGVVRELRGKVLAHVLRLPPLNLLRWPRGELASRIQVEVHGVRTLLHVGVAQGIRSILMASALATVALRVDTALATPGLIVLPMAVAVIVFAARPTRRLQRGLFEAETAVVADTAEAIDGASVLRAYAAVMPRWTKVDAAAAESQQRGVVAETWSAAAAPLVELAGAVGIAAVFAFAWWMRSDVDLPTTGTVLVALILMYRPLHGLAQALFGWWAGLASLDRLDELLRLPAQPLPQASTRKTPISSLRFRSLAFRYGEQPVFGGANVLFRAGELVVVTGPSGVGKSTLLALLAGILRPTEGSVSIDGLAAAPAVLSAATAWMPQNPALFHDTIAHNIALGDEPPDRMRVIAAARRADVEPFVALRPEGYEGILREGGTDLSMGQRQRVTLARALYRDAPILLLDEPTAALDHPTETKVIQICREEADRGVLVIVATHREDFLRHADRVLELRDGMVIEWDERTGATLH